MNFWFPRMPAKRWWAAVQITVLGAVVAGIYGALHDQISFTISPEYFTKMKFHQFAYANFGWPQRVFASEVGFLGTWWVGLIAGWIVARAGLAEIMEMSKRPHLVTVFVMVIGMAATAGLIGAMLGIERVNRGMSDWAEWKRGMAIQDLPEFVIVAYLHAAGYLGGLLGVVRAVIYVRLKLAKLRKLPRT
jgi:hypothetical protein